MTPLPREPRNTDDLFVVGGLLAGLFGVAAYIGVALEHRPLFAVGIAGFVVAIVLCAITEPR